MNHMPPHALTPQGFENRRHLLRLWLEPEDGRPLDHSGERTGSSAGRHTPSAASPLVEPPCRAAPCVTDYPTADLALPRSIWPAPRWHQLRSVTVVAAEWPAPAGPCLPPCTSAQRLQRLPPALALYCTGAPQGLSTVRPLGLLLRVQGRLWLPWRLNTAARP